MRASLILRSTAIVGLALAAVACGSTLPDSAFEALGASEAGLGGTPGTGTPTSGSSSPGTSLPTGGVPGIGPGSGGTGPATAPGVSAPGVTATTIKIGFSYDRDAGSSNEALGVSGADQIDEKRAMEALVADMNKNGGVGGRKLQVVWHEFSSLSNKSFEQLDQERCARWTQDDRVFGAIGGGDSETTLKSCLSKIGIAQVGALTTPADSTLYRSYPLFVGITPPSYDRLARVGVNNWDAMGFYRQKKAGFAAVKLGVVAYDRSVYRRTLDVLRGELAKRNVSIADSAFIREPESNQELAGMFAATRAAVVKFNGEGISHVHFLATNNALLEYVFMQNAERQAYRPSYGLTSQSAPQSLSDLLGTDAKNQMPGAMIVGWDPIFDVQDSDYSGSRELPGLTRCKKILHDAYGETFNDPTRNKESQARDLCDEMWYFKAAVEAGGPVVTPQSWLQGVAKVTLPKPAGTFVLSTRSDKHDAVGAIRRGAYFSDCNCFHYTSGVIAL